MRIAIAGLALLAGFTAGAHSPSKTLRSVDLAEVIAPAGARCRSEVREVLEAVDRYGDAEIAKRRGSGGQSEADEIFARLSHELYVAVPDGHPCHGPAVQAYYAGSLLLLQSEGSGGLWRSDAGPALVAAHLARAGKLRLAGPPPKVRGKDAWGDYACTQGRILVYANPSLRPYDAGAAMVHELDHMLRDQTASLAGVRARYPGNTDAGIDWDAYNMADETLATVLAAAQQRRVAFHRFTSGSVSLIASSPREGDASAARPLDSRPPFTVDQDLSLVNPGGPLDELDRRFLGDPLTPFYPGALGPLRFSMRDWVEKTQSVLSEFYIGQGAKVPCDLFAPPHPGEPQPFAEAYWPDRYAAMERLGDEFGRPPATYAGMNEIKLRALRRRRMSDEIPPIPGLGRSFAESLAELDRRLAHPSPVCQAYVQAISAGEVDRNYAGFELGPADRAAGGDGGKPGGDGAKPAGSGLHF